MKNNKIINIGTFTKEDALKAFRVAGREMDLANSTGWISVCKPHKSLKDYTRKPKHKKAIHID